MKRISQVLSLTVLLLAACGEQTRDGMLTLAGSNPLRIMDESGKVVEFVTGPAKIEFSADRSRKFTVTVSQGKDKQAKFSGQAPASSGWNFTLRGKDINQPFDLTSDRKVAYIGQPWRSIHEGAPCGYNGRMVVEEVYQSCMEDWNANFADASNSQAIGSFSSHLDSTCLISSRDLYCRDYGPYPPYPRHLDRVDKNFKKLKDLGPGGIKFD